MTERGSLVLLVEAEEGSLGTFRNLLQMQNYGYRVFSGGMTELSDVLGGSDVDVIVTDRRMRDAEGVEMLLLFRRLREGSGVILIARDLSDVGIADLLPSLHVRVLVEPVRAAEFLAAAAQLLVVPST